MKELNQNILGKGFFAAIKGHFCLIKGHLDNPEVPVDVEQMTPISVVVSVVTLMIQKTIFMVSLGE